MPRTYKTPIGITPRPKYNKDAIIKAFESVTSGEMSQAEACRHYKVKKSTLNDKIKGKTSVNSDVGRSTALNPRIEYEIANTLEFAARWGYPLEKREISNIVTRYLHEKNINILRFKDNVPGPDWVSCFMKRNKQLTTRLANNIKRSRAIISPADIDKFFDNISPHLHGVSPASIYNYNESNLSDDPDARKMIFKRGVKYPDNIINFSKSSISFMMCVSASGVILPPYVVYKAKEVYLSWTQGGPAGAPFCQGPCCASGVKYTSTESGWFDMNAFERWFFECFIPHSKNIEGVKILLGDNLSAHFTPRVLLKCHKENILFVCLPPNSTHLLQPLDVAFFGPLENTWKSMLIEYKRKFPNQTALSKNKFPQMLKQLFNHEKMANQNANAIAGFAACGLCPLDRERVKQKLPRVPLQTPPFLEVVDDNTIPLGQMTSTLLNYMQDIRGYSPAEGNSSRDHGRRGQGGLQVTPKLPVSVSTLEESRDPDNPTRCFVPRGRSRGSRQLSVPITEDTSESEFSELCQRGTADPTDSRDSAMTDSESFSEGNDECLGIGSTSTSPVSNFSANSLFKPLKFSTQEVTDASEVRVISQPGILTTPYFKSESIDEESNEETVISVEGYSAYLTDSGFDIKSGFGKSLTPSFTSERVPNGSSNNSSAGSFSKGDETFSNCSTHEKLLPIPKCEDVAISPSSGSFLQCSSVVDGDKSCQSTLIIYDFSDHDKIFRVRVPVKYVTFKIFKEKLPKRGNFRFYFKNFCRDFGTVFDEITSESEVLPLYDGNVYSLILEGESQTPMEFDVES